MNNLNVLHFHQPMAPEKGLVLPIRGFEEQIVDTQAPQVESFALVPQLSTEISVLPDDSKALSRFGRVVEGLGVLVNRLNESGVAALLIGGAASWPGPAATVSRAIIHTTQVAGTYHKVRQVGFTGTEALARTMWWTVVGR